MILAKKYGGYTNIPKTEKNEFWNRFRETQAISRLKQMSSGKCSYCESHIEVTSYIEIDHFYPQAMYPTVAYSWKNLLPCCSRCNKAKSDWDPKKAPILNPSKENPMNFIAYTGVSPIPHKDLNEPDIQRVLNTIQALKLDRSAILRARQTIFVLICDLEIQLKEKLEHLKRPGVRVADRNEVKLAITSTLKTLEKQLSDNNQFTGWLLSLLKASPIIREALANGFQIRHEGKQI